MSTSLFSKPFLSNFWAKNKNSIWLASAIRLHRNLKTHHFPHKLSGSFLSDLTQMLKHPIENCPKLKKGHFFFFKDLLPHEKQLLFEYYLSRHNYQSLHGGEGLFVDLSSHMHVLINTKDHIILNCVDTSNHLEEAWNKLMHIENELSQEIEFAFSSKFGFLTSNIGDCGTGLHIDLFLHLPALAHSNQLDDVLEKNASLGHDFSSIYGQSDDFTGDVIVLSNMQTLGLSEEQLIKTMHSYALNLIISEKKARDSIEENPSEMKNKVSKALGTLKHAYQLGVKEAFECLSLCKLGVELDWIKGLPLEMVNELFFSVGKGVLKLNLQDLGSDPSEQRAQLIKREIEKATF